MRYVFGEWTLDTQRAELSHAGRVCRLRRKAFQVLVYLLAHADRVVSKQELCEQVWPQQFLSDAALEGTIKAVRQVLGDSGREQRLIQTVYGQGYRFIVPVEVRPEIPAGGFGAGHLASRRPQTVLPQAAKVLVPEFSPQEADRSVAGVPEMAARDEVAALQPHSGASSGAWKLVTVLCCALAEPPRGMPREAEPHYRALQALSALVQEAVQRYGGTLQPVVRDQLLALFGAPQAQEDHARCAVLAALDLLQCQPAPGTALAVRIGVSSGLAVVGALGPEAHGPVTVVGEPAQVALRLQQRAVPGTLLVSAETYQLVREEVQGEPCGSLVLDESQTPQQVYAIQGLVRRRAGVPQRATPIQGPFVGRQRELALLHDRLEAAQGGEGQVVSLVGPPGIGKTRLLTEFGRSLAPHRATWALGQCLAYG